MFSACCKIKEGLIYHVYARQCCTLCYGQCQLSIGKGHFRPLTDQKPLNRSTPNFAHLITSSRSRDRPNFITIGSGVGPPRYVVCAQVCGFFLFVLGPAYSSHRAEYCHTLYTSRRGWYQGCAFWGSHQQATIPGGVISKIDPPMGIYSLKFYADCNKL